MINKILNILDALFEFKVDYVLIGGFAINLYGLERGTHDIDIFINADKKNIDRMVYALKSVYQDKAIDEITLEELNEYAVIRYGTPDNFNIDIITHIGELFTYNDIEYKKTEIDSHIINLATPETLLRLKSNSYRQIDLSDTIFLRKIIERANNADL